MSESRPGYGTSTDYTMSEILASLDRLITRGITLLKDQGVLKKGTVLGKITSGGKFRQCNLILTAALASTDTHMRVADSQGVNVGDVLTIASTLATAFPVTVTAITSGTQIAINAPGTGNTAASGDRIHFNDGSETAIAILADQVDTDDADVITEAYLGGIMKSASLIGLHSACVTALNGRTADSLFIF